MATRIGFRVADDRMAKKKCWMRTDTNEYLGRLTHFEYGGRPYDQNVDLTFEHGFISDADTKNIFKVVPCADASGGSAGGRRRRRTRRRQTRRRR